MKKIIYLAVSALLSFSSCSDFLDKKPLDSLTEDAVFNDDALLTAYVTACYNAYPNGFDEAMSSSATDESYTRHGDGSSNIVARGEMNPDNVENFDSGRFSNFNYWNTAYEYLRNINTFFAKYEEAQVTEELKSRLYGEMKFIRAFVYSNLIWRFGGVPIITKAYTLEDTDYSITRNTYEECVDFILKDLDEAIEHLPAKMEGENKGRASADACKALKSRLLLYVASPLVNTSNDLKKWELARDAAKAVIDLPGYSLASDYRTLFLEDNDEVIFRRYYTKANANRVNLFNSPNGYGGWGGNCPIQNLVDDYEMIDGSKFSWDNPEHKAEPYKNRDPRFYACVLYDGAKWRQRPDDVIGSDPEGIVQTGFYENANGSYNPGLDTRQGPIEDWNGTYTGYYMRKFIDPAVNHQYDRQNYPFRQIRYAEVLLNYAEACLELGDEGEAVKYINKIRTRAGMPDIPMGVTGAALVERYRNERKIELAYEQHRYFDIRRWMIAPDVIKNAQGIDIRYPYGGGKQVYSITEVQERGWKNKSYFLPILLDEIQKNELLIQNPDY